MRLSWVLSDTALEFQSAFFGGRQRLANEVIEDLDRRGRQGIVLKLDFEKAYDRLKWRFLGLVLKRKGLEIGYV